MGANRAFIARWLAYCGLIILIAVILFPVPTALTVTVSVPLVALLIAGLKPPSKWGGWVAVMMIPYLSVALAEAIIDSENRISYVIIVVCTLIIFFAAMDYVRASGASLRR